MATQKYPPDPEKTLSAKQRKAALLLAHSNTIDKTAAEVGVNEKTIDTWKKLPAFQEAIRAAEDELYNDALRLLKKSAKLAVGCLLRNMDSKVTSYVQVQAAGKLLDSSMEMQKMARMEELEQKLDELEQLLRERGIVNSGNVRRIK